MINQIKRCSLTVSLFFLVFSFFSCENGTGPGTIQPLPEVIVYTAGWYAVDWEGGGGGTLRIRASFWTDEVRTDLTTLTLSEWASANSVVVDNGKVYITGFYADRSGSGFVFYWVNGQRIDLTDHTFSFNASASGIAVVPK